MVRLCKTNEPRWLQHRVKFKVDCWNKGSIRTFGEKWREDRNLMAPSLSAPKNGLGEDHVWNPFSIILFFFSAIEFLCADG